MKPRTENLEKINPPFTIKSLKRKNWREETGDDLIRWDVIVKTKDYETWIPISFLDLKSYCQNKHPETAEYFSSVRRNIPGFGPKHSKMFKYFDEEGFEFAPLIEESILHCRDIEAQHQWELNLKKNPGKTQKTAKKVSSSLSEGFPSMKKAALQQEEFTDNILDFINKEALRIYPEILEGNPDHIKKLHNVLTTHILRLGEDIGNLAYRAEKSKG